MSETTPKARKSDIGHVDLYSRTGEKSLDEKVLQPYRHMAQYLRRSKIMLVTNAYNQWFNIPKEKLVAIEDILRILYNAGLLFDDIEDRSRGSPVAHSIYGARSTLAAANYAYSIVLDKILDFIEAEEHIAETIHAVAEIFVEAFRGQGLEIYWCPIEEEYFQMCGIKLNGLFNLVTCLMSSCSGRRDDFSKFNNLLAEGFQIVDDYENFTSKDSFKRKTITEGKFTLPIIHADRSHPEDQQIIGTLSRFQLKLLNNKLGSLEYTRKRIAQIREDVTREGKKFGNNPPMDILIKFALGIKE